MLSKVVAGKVIGGCSHTTPIFVPCRECVEKQLENWEQRIRDEERKAKTDEMKQSIETAADCMKLVERMQNDQAEMKETISGLHSTIQKLRGLLDDAKNDAAGLRAQLHANQAVKSAQQLRTVSE